MKVKKVNELRQFETGNKWLVEGLVLHQGQTLICGAPKVGKSFFIWNLAVNVSMGSSVLDKYVVSEPQRVLVANLEDSEQIQRERIESVARAKGISAPLDRLGILQTPSLKLDNPDDVAKLRDAISEFKADLVILDCMVRLHDGSESSSSHVAQILGELTKIKNDLNTGIVLVHHTRKDLKKSVGSNVRGSSEAFAWCDTLIMLQKNNDGIEMSVTHRAAESFGDVALELAKINEATTIRAKALSAIAETTGPSVSQSIELQILSKIQSYRFPITLNDIAKQTGRDVTEVRNAIFHLIKSGRIQFTNRGYVKGQLS